MSKTLDSSQCFVNLSHGRTRYFDVGSGAPTILLHGVGFSAGGTSWYRNIDRLSEGLRVLAVDLVGWGIGDRLEQGYSFAYLVDFVREFQDALGLGRSNIVGHSMGGWIASLFAYESPERVNRLALTASGGTATRTLAQMTEFQPPTKEATYERIAALPDISEADARDWTEYDWANIQTPGALESYRKILSNMNVAETRSRYNTLRRLPYIVAKTLVVWGTNDEVNDISLGQTTAELIPDARFVTFDCGHMVPHEAPAKLNEELLGFFCS
ncbi:MAG TPA: alpha/beta hydrolase [Acidimicrobiales bacterium]|nr:alpha/beta hydrolase [Acidimicrobiales bacterium]